MNDDLDSGSESENGQDDSDDQPAAGEEVDNVDGEFGATRPTLNTPDMGSCATVAMPKLIAIMLGDSHLGCTGLKRVFPFLVARASRLTSLDLSHNRISSRGTAMLGAILVIPGSSLLHLRASWNSLGNRGLSALLRPLAHAALANDWRTAKLRSLDISWNAIGSKTSGRSNTHDTVVDESVSLLAKLLEPGRMEVEGEAEPNSTMPLSSDDIKRRERDARELRRKNSFQGGLSALVHLDLSSNGLTATDVLALASALQYNFSLSGLHIDHNPGGGFVDSRGFIRPASSASLQRTLAAAESLSPRMMPPLPRPAGKAVPPDVEAEHLANSAFASLVSTAPELTNEISRCWCCGSWVERDFFIRIPEAGIRGSLDAVVFCSVRLRLAIDGWEPCEMEYVPPEQWRLHRMVPPNMNILFCIEAETHEGVIFDVQLPDSGGQRTAAFGCPSNGTMAHVINMARSSDCPTVPTSATAGNGPGRSNSLLPSTGSPRASVSRGSPSRSSQCRTTTRLTNAHKTTPMAWDNVDAQSLSMSETYPRRSVHRPDFRTTKQKKKKADKPVKLSRGSQYIFFT